MTLDSSDWLDRLLDRAPLPVWIVAVAFGVAVLSIVGVAALVLEQPAAIVGRGFLGNRDLRFGLTITALAAYIPAARHYLLVSAAHNRAALRTLLSARSVAVIDAPIRWPPVWVPWLIVPMVPLIAFAIDRDPGLYFRSGYWHVGNVWTWILGTFMAWCLGRAVVATVAVSRQFSAIAAALPDIDLLDRRWLAPFV
ncbi:MAG: hypothetical protein ABFS41_09760, partial [Myxococcota bacterium]